MSRLSRAIAIRPGEGRLVVLVAGAFAAVEAGRGLGEVGVDTLVLSRSGADILPYLYIGLGAVGLVVTLTYGAALARSASQYFFPSVLVILAAVLAAEWLIALSGAEAILPLIWVSVYAAGLLLLTAMWTVGGFTFDARQAKRLFPLLTSAAIVGSLTGFLSAIAVQRLIGAEFLILAEAGLFLVAAALLMGLGPRTRPRRAPGAATPSLKVALTAGAGYVAASPLMRLVAIAYVLLAILMFSLTFPFMTAMSEAFPDESELLTMLALFSAAVTVVSFLAGTLLANRLYARLGVATVALALPIVYLAGFGLWIVRFSLATAVIVRFAQQVTQRGVSNAAFGTFYSVIPSAKRGQVLAFIDGVPGQLGTVLSGILLIVATSLAMEQVFVMGFVAAIACLVVMLLARRAYATSLVATLREGRAEQVLEGGPGLEGMRRDARVIAELRTASHSDNPLDRRFAAEMLMRARVQEAAPDLERLATDSDADVRVAAVRALAALSAIDASATLIQALDDDDGRVRAAAVAALRLTRTADLATAELLARLADDRDPQVRCELAVALQASEPDATRELLQSMLGSTDAAERAAGLDAARHLSHVPMEVDMEALAADPAPEVRAAAIRAGDARTGIETERLVLALDDPAAGVRQAATDALASRKDAGPHLLVVLREGSVRAQGAALDAMSGHVDEVRPELIVWAEAEVQRATMLRGNSQALASADPATTAGYLHVVVTRREATIEAGLLSALAILGAPEASGLIRRCLRAPDPEVRAQAIEALDTLGDPSLTRGVVGLLERDGDDKGDQTLDIVAAATALSDDRDRWLRALALRTLAEQLRLAQRAVAARVGSDPDPLIRDVVEVEAGEDEMPETLELVSDVDRMIVLRRVPLFAALDPEDLHRVASAAVERAWGAGDDIMVEGEVGDELVVIVEGGVRVVHRTAADEHDIRTYGPGDHIGELAVLREAPRAATVIAGDGGMRGLVINGEAISALLRERPDAAMAMLGTLAERLSQQA